MDVLSYAIITLFLLSCASSPLSYASPTRFSRRHLSQAPPTDPSTFTPGGSPFFPVYGSSSSPTPPSLPPPSLPPPSLPPPSTTPVTFPANISALVLPRSPKPHTTSRTLIIPAISAVLAVATAIGLALFLYGRWRGQQVRNFKEESKSSVSDISHSEETPPCPPPRNTTENKLTVTASTSDVLYLGNVVASGSSFIKPESPEIRPLPPLPARSFLQHNSETNPSSSDEDGDGEDDDFYSPLASLAGKESHNHRRNNPYSTCSGSLSSSSVSPTMSPSVTTSPAAPRWSTQNPSSPESHRTRNNKRYAPSLRMFSLWNQNLGFPRISSASTSPERGGGAIRTPDAYARSSMYSSVSTTPERFFRKVLESSPPRWNDFSRNVKSLFLSSASSPAKDFTINISESSRTLRSSWENPELDSTESVAPPPQRPPPEMPEPPPLLPPSQSFMVQKPGKKLSFSELPLEAERNKPKMKPLPWERVRARSCRKNTWDSHKFNNTLNTNPKQRSLSFDLPMLNQETRVFDSRKCQNIELSANDVCQALQDGNCEALGVELLESLSTMVPSDEEEGRLMSYNGDSVMTLAPSERFLKELLNVPFVFKRVDAFLAVAKFNSKVEHLRRSFGFIEAACEELRNSETLLKLVEAVLEKGKLHGNGRDFKLEALLELVDGSDTPLHYVIRNIMESEGMNGLVAVGNLSSVLIDVKRSAEMDYSVLRSEVSTLYQGVEKIREVLLLREETGHNDEFRESMTRFLETAAVEIKKIETEEAVVVSAVKEVTKCYHGEETHQLLRVFVIVRDFLSILDKVCNKMECE